LVKAAAGVVNLVHIESDGLVSIDIRPTTQSEVQTVATNRKHPKFEPAVMLEEALDRGPHCVKTDDGITGEAAVIVIHIVLRECREAGVDVAGLKRLSECG
jgi:hypothetical protein